MASARLVGLISLIALVALGGCSMKIEVGGTSGLRYSGSIGEDGSSHSVDGTVPHTYSVSGDIVVGVFQKDERSGKLTAKIARSCGIFGTDTLDRASTTAEYGVVTVSHAG